MNLGKLIQTSLTLWGLLGILLLFVAMLAFSRNHQLSRDRTAILVIGLLLLTALVVLSTRGNTPPPPLP